MKTRTRMLMEALGRLHAGWRRNGPSKDVERRIKWASRLRFYRELWGPDKARETVINHA